MSATESLDLYHYLCHLFGSDEVIKTRRSFYKICELIREKDVYQYIISGSKGEGLDFTDSDMDIMYISKKFEVNENVTIAPFSANRIHFIMDIEDVKPGFTKLKLDPVKRIRYNFVKKYCRESEMYLSNVEKEDKFVTDDLSIIHGPCNSDPQGKFDFAFTLHCKDWISPAQPWIYRPRYSWPSSDVMSNIIQHGTLFVPIGIKGSKNEDIEWRISFSSTYLRFLSHSVAVLCFTQTTFKTY